MLGGARGLDVSSRAGRGPGTPREGEDRTPCARPLACCATGDYFLPSLNHIFLNSQMQGVG